MPKPILALTAIAVSGLLILPSAQNSANKGRTIVLEASRIEGKLKRPQAALLAIEKRPVFKPIALTTNSFQKDILKNVDSTVFEYRVYTDAFPIASK